MKFSIKDFFGKCDQIRKKLHVLCNVANTFEFNISKGHFSGMSFIWKYSSKLKISIHLFIHLFIHECAKFCGSRTIMGLVNLVPSCLRGSKIHSRGYFVGPKFFLVGILWVRIFFVWVFRGFKIFFSLVFHGSRFFSRGHFVVTRERKWGIETSKCHTPQPINME